jgi:hypothetical protein
MKKIIYYLFFASLIYTSCKVDEEFEGPSLVDLYGDFSIIDSLDITNRTVNFSTGESTAFTASFSKNVNWKLEVKGLQSEAVKRFEGFSNSLTAANANWNGTTTDLPMFRVEDCAVVLTIENVADTLRDTLSVLGSKVYQGFVVADFENGWNPGWNKYVQSGANMSFAVLTNASAAQGNRYYEMAGEVSWDWLIGLVNMPGTAYGATHYPLTNNPSNLYFNTMLYKPAGIDNGLVLFQIKEDDNEDGMYSAGTEDMYSIQVSLSEAGWSKISQRYDNIPTLVNGASSGPIGNGLHEPNKIIEVSTLFLANPTSGYSKSWIDYMIFTEGSALEP